jgi:predicted metal-dependent hydrolase
MGRGARFGWGFPPAPYSLEAETPFLEQRKAWLESQLAAINEQMKKAGDSE